LSALLQPEKDAHRLSATARTSESRERGTNVDVS